MRRYRVFEPPGAEGPSEGVRFLRDGFSLWALVLPSLWLLRHRLFAFAIAVFLLDVLIKLTAGGAAAFLLSLLLGLAVALEGSSLRAARLGRRGWWEAGSIWARDERDAELLYFAGEPTRPMEEDAPVLTSDLLSSASPLRPGRSLFDLREA